MANVLYSSNIVATTGKLRGTVYQGNKTTNIARVKTSPKNPESESQQRTRQSIQLASRSWRLLSDGDRSSWFGCLTVSLTGFNLFMSVNVPLLISGAALQTTFSCPVSTAIFERPYFASQFE